MTAEIAYAGLTGKTLKAQMAQATVVTADIALVEVGTSGYYVGNASGAAGFYNVYITEGTIIVGVGTLNWDGTAEVKLPSVIPGAAGGLFIAGSNAATTISGLTTGALATGTITTTGGWAVSGTFGVAGVTTLGGLTTGALATGNITTTGAVSVSGNYTINGVTTHAAVTYAAFTTAAFTPSSISVSGTTTLSGAVSFGSTFGVAGAVTYNSFTCSNGMTVSGASGLSVSTLVSTGVVTLASLGVTGTTTHTGATVYTGNVSYADGITIAAPSTGNRSGLSISGNGSGHGISASGQGGGTGHGIYAVSGSGATGDGIRAVSAASAGNGMYLLGTTTGNGLLTTGGAGAGGDGIEAVAGGGVPIRGDLTGNITGTLATVTTLTNLPAITANWLTATGINAAALNGKGDWNVGKTGYTLSQTFPTNFAALKIEVTSGIVDANIQKINDVTITGTGTTPNEFGVA